MIAVVVCFLLDILSASILSAVEFPDGQDARPSAQGFHLDTSTLLH